MGTPKHAQIKHLSAIGRVLLDQDSSILILDVLRRIRKIRINTQCGAYLLADSDGYLYLLRAESPVSDRMARELSRMVVGLYSDGVSITPTAACLLSEIHAHLSKYHGT